MSCVVGVKKEGAIYLCCDYWKLNGKKCPTHICITKYPKCNRQFMKQNFFALLDQSKVYHQLHLHFDIWKCTAFITSWSFYQLVNLPYGLINVPTCFQRFMEQCLSDYPEWLPFFTIPPKPVDILRSLDNHLHDLWLTLQRLKMHGIKRKASKFQLFCWETVTRNRISVFGGLYCWSKECSCCDF